MSQKNKLDLTKKMNSYFLAKNILNPILKLLVDVRSSGRENIPKDGGFLLVSNHRSDMDPWIIGSTCPRYIAWISDYYVFDLPGIGFLLKESGAIPMSTSRVDQIKGYKICKSVLDAGQPIGIFPEGHKTIAEHLQHLDLGEFYEGFANYALRCKVPIVPISILPRKEKYEPIIFPKFARRLFNMPEDVMNTEKRLIYQKVHVHYGPLIKIEPYLETIKSKGNSKESMKEARKQIASECHLSIKMNVQKHIERGKWENVILNSKM